MVFDSHHNFYKFQKYKPHNASYEHLGQYITFTR